MPWKEIPSHPIHYATFEFQYTVAYDWSINKTKLLNDPHTSDIFLKDRNVYRARITL